MYLLIPVDFSFLISNVSSVIYTCSQPMIESWRCTLVPDCAILCLNTNMVYRVRAVACIYLHIILSITKPSKVYIH